jgi:transcriptional/translational regulatory protein YebC/TACO1
MMVVQDEREAERMQTLVALLEDHDDVVAVYTNAV